MFAIPGLGRLTVDAILRRDYPVIQGVVLLFSFVYVLVNLLIDLLYTRARSEDPLLTAPPVITVAAPDAFTTAMAPDLIASAPDLPDLLPPVKPRRGLVGLRAGAIRPSPSAARWCWRCC